MISVPQIGQLQQSWPSPLHSLVTNEYYRTIRRVVRYDLVLYHTKHNIIHTKEYVPCIALELSKVVTYGSRLVLSYHNALIAVAQLISLREPSQSAISATIEVIHEAAALAPQLALGGKQMAEINRIAV